VDALLDVHLFGLPFVDDGDFILFASLQSPVDAPVQLFEVFETFHLVPDHKVLVGGVGPVGALSCLIRIQFETTFFVDCLGYVAVVDANVKGSIHTLDKVELIAEMELRDEAARPRVLLQARLRSQVRWEVGEQVPSLVGQHVPIGLDGGALARFGVALASTPQLGEGVLLEAAMVLIERAQVVVHFRVDKVDVGSEADNAGLARASQTSALVVVPEGELPDVVSLSVKDVSQREKDYELDQEDVKAATPCRRHDLVSTVVVEDPF